MSWLGISSWSFIFFFTTGLLAAGVVTCIQRIWIDPSTGEPAGAGGAERSRQGKAHLERARLLLSRDRLHDAFQEFSLASRLNPEDPEPPAGMGLVYEKLYLAEQAERAYRGAIQVDPEYLPARKRLARLLYETGRNREAITLWKEIQKKDPGDPVVWSELAINELRLGNPEEAARLLKKYIQVRGKRAWSYAHLGRAYLEMSDFEAAEEAYREALSLDPYLSNGYLWLGQLLIATGRREEATGVLEKFHRLRDLLTREHKLQSAHSRSPDNIEILGELTRVRFLLGKRDQALQSLRRALELAPEDPRLLKLLEAYKRSRKKPLESS